MTDPLVLPELLIGCAYTHVEQLQHDASGPGPLALLWSL